MKKYLLLLFLFPTVIFAQKYAKVQGKYLIANNQYLKGHRYTNILDTSVRFYIFAGQSNMGRCLASQISVDSIKFNGLQNNVKIYSPSYNKYWNNLTCGINTQLVNYNSTNEFGPETSFAYYMPKDTDIYIFKYGIGGSSLAGIWLKTSATTQYWYFINELTNAAKEAKLHNIKLILKGFVWMQGEQDATTVSMSDNYLFNLTYFFDNQINVDIERILIQYGHTYQSDYKKVIGRINGVNDPSEIYRTTVRQAQYDYCQILANNAYLIDTDGYPFLDYVHYNWFGQLKFGIDIYNILKN